MEDETRGVDATNTAAGGSDGGVGGGAAAAVGGSGVDGDGGGGSSSRVPATSIASDFAMADVRQRYTVELKPGETTIVSWKKLVKDARKSNGPPPLLPAAVAPPGAHPALNSRVDPGQSVAEANDAPAPNRYSAVIEKIERLYMGNQSSEEEELDDTPDDDQYDTEDSFIDDADLDEYFQVDKSTTKHTGFFVNRGKLESTNEPEPEPNQQPRKRRRKDSKNACGEENGEHVPNKHSKLVDSRMKATMEIAPLAGSKSSIASHSVAATGKHNENGKSQNRNASMVHKVKKSAVPSNALVRDAPLAPLALREENDTEKQKVGLTHSRDSSDKLKVASEPSDATHQTSMKVHHREKNGSSEVLNLSAGKHPLKSADISPMHAKDSPSVRTKGSMLERAMRDLEKIVAESRPPSTEVQDSTDPSFQAVKRRLPREVKQKLAKVARLASSQGKIPDELIRRLMGILGHIVQLRTLKRNLKEMVELGLSAKQEKDKKCQQIKEEVIEMIKKHGPWLNPKASEQHDGTSDNFKDGVSSKGKGLHGGKSGMDNVMEEKICEIYDLYVEDEDRLPRIRKLYMELAELWPNGYMDNHGIKNAVNRAKERKRALQGQRKEQEKIKRKKLSPSSKREDTFFGEAKSVAQPRFAQERIVKDGNRVLTPPSRMTSSHTLPKQHLSPSGRASNTSISGSSLDRPKQDKIKVNTSAFLEDARKTMDGALLTKKLKRKSGSDVGDIHSRPEKMPLQQGKERLKPSNHRISSHPNRPNDHSADFLSREQPS